jgi:hypothetical protein
MLTAAQMRATASECCACRPSLVQVRISRWFGELESTFYKHPHSPHPDVFRVSNDRQHGCTGLVSGMSLHAGMLTDASCLKRLDSW